MAVAVVVDIPGGNAEAYGQIIATAFPGDELPEGWTLHVAGPTENGWRIVNVVPSQEQFELFARQRLRPGLQQVGEGDVTPEIAFFSVHKLIWHLA
jgi:hypothetical protein